MKQRALSLVEVLIVLLVISVLMGVALPVIASAKAASRKGVALSNLRQTALALILYQESFDRFPSLETARSVVGKDISCDPSDDWRTSCDERWDPLLGSFGYAVPANWEEFFEGARQRRDVPLVVSIFHQSPRVSPFKGDAPPITGDARLNFRMPSTVICGRTDGSAVRVVVARAAREGEVENLTWSSLFFKLVWQ